MGNCGGKAQKADANAAPAAATPAAATPAAAPAAEGEKVEQAPPQMAAEAPTVNADHDAAIRKFATNMGDADICKEVCTEDVWVSPPDAPHFPLEQFTGMMSGYKAVFPDWVSKVGAIVFEAEDDTTITYKVETQQRVGCMKADMPEMGPFPACTLEEAPARIKETECILPFEKGLVVIIKETGKIASCDYNGELGETADATTMDMDPPTGMKMLYTMLGKELPAPPAAEDAAPADA